MPTKQYYLEQAGLITLSKKRGNRHIRLRVTPKGEVKVSMPPWVPYQSGVLFVQKNLDWIAKQQKVSSHVLLESGMAIGKFHRLVINHVAESTGRISTRVTDTEIRLKSQLDSTDPDVQSKVFKACERALKLEAEKLLPQRLDQLAKKYGYSYKDLNIKRLTTRWGSCSSHDNIALSSYLIQLPWHLIDYVLVHELVHTVHKHHQADFWEELAQILPATQALRKELKNWRPTLLPNSR